MVTECISYRVYGCVTQDYGRRFYKIQHNACSMRPEVSPTDMRIPKRVIARAQSKSHGPIFRYMYVKLRNWQPQKGQLNHYFDELPLLVGGSVNSPHDFVVPFVSFQRAPPVKPKGTL